MLLFLFNRQGFHRRIVREDRRVRGFRPERRRRRIQQDLNVFVVSNPTHPVAINSENNNPRRRISSIKWGLEIALSWTLVFFLDPSFVPYLKQGVAFSDNPEVGSLSTLLDVATGRWWTRVFLVKN